MEIPHKIFVFFTFLFIFIKCDDCGLQKGDDDKLKKLVETIKDKSFDVSSDKYKYHLNICRKKESDLISVYQQFNQTVNRSIGNFPLTQLRGKVERFSLIRQVKDSSNVTITTTIIIICGDYKKDSIEIFTENEAAFVFSIEVECKLKKKKSSSSFGTLMYWIFILSLIAFFLYMTLGIIHRRMQHGHRGWMQIPHYKFWLSIFAILVELKDRIVDRIQQLFDKSTRPNDYRNLIGTNHINQNVHDLDITPSDYNSDHEQQQPLNDPQHNLLDDEKILNP
ncbi:hypothetical protein SNEBB_011451 [Seison nebaliae]|nr:hypothetical protein SNEBB_011451 [Seison nebaliae]